MDPIGLLDIVTKKGVYFGTGGILSSTLFPKD
jgi:hypothetical protein